MPSVCFAALQGVGRHASILQRQCTSQWSKVAEPRGKSPPLSLKPQFVADTGGMCRISGSGFPIFFWFPHQSPAHPASSRRVARIIQMRLMFPPQGKSNGECRGQAVSLRRSRLSTLGWGTAEIQREIKAQFLELGQGSIEPPGCKLTGKTGWI